MPWNEDMILISIKYFTYPIPFRNTHDCLSRKVVDGLTETIDNLFQSGEYFISEALGSQLSPDLFDGIHFRSIGWNVEQRYVFGNFHRFGLVPGCPIADQQNIVIRILLGKLTKEDVHPFCIAIGQDQEEAFSCHRLNCTIGISILSDMVTWDFWSDTGRTPAILGFVDPSESCLILEHEPYFLLWILYTMLLYYAFNFFVAVISSSSAFFGCRDLGMTFRHLCLSRTM